LVDGPTQSRVKGQMAIRELLLLGQNRETVAGMKLRNVLCGFVVVGVIACGGEGGSPSTSTPATGGSSGSSVGPTGAGGAAMTGIGPTGAGGAAIGGGSPTSTGGASGTSVNQLALYKSGSRIKARVGRTPDGSQEFLGWFDSKRNEECVFFVGSDGVRRCLPFQLAVDGSFFSDAKCEMKLVYASCTQSPSYVRIGASADVCKATPNPLYKLGAQYTGTVYQKTPNCLPMAPTQVTTYKFWQVGESVAETEFQEQTVAIE
jgi:hypothetical protein